MQACFSVAKCQYCPRYRKIALTVANLFTYLLHRITETTELTKKLCVEQYFSRVATQNQGWVSAGKNLCLPDMRKNTSTNRYHPSQKQDFPCILQDKHCNTSVSAGTQIARRQIGGDEMTTRRVVWLVYRLLSVVGDLFDTL